MSKLRPARDDVKDTRSALKSTRGRARKLGDDAQAAGAKLVAKILDIGIDGYGRFASAGTIAAKAERKSRNSKRAVKRVVRLHVRRARVAGFVSGLGGFITLAVTLPANLLTFYATAARMVGAIAEIRGYDLQDEQVRSTVLVSLTGPKSQKILEQAGLGAITSRLTSPAVDKLPDSALMMLNKGVGVALLRTVGSRGLTRFVRWIPLLGALVGQWADARMMRRISRTADSHFPPKD